MKILIVSDTHRQNENYFKVIEKEKPVDMLIHCGDAEGSENCISESADCPTEIVIGNNDFFSDLPREREFKIGKYSVWVTHGHNYYVSIGNDTIKEEAIDRHVDIVMYGHTHKPVINIDEQIIALNPGSLTFPRQGGKRPSYIVMEVAENGEANFEICYL